MPGQGLVALKSQSTDGANPPTHLRKADDRTSARGAGRCPVCSFRDPGHRLSLALWKRTEQQQQLLNTKLPFTELMHSLSIAFSKGDRKLMKEAVRARVLVCESKSFQSALLKSCSRTPASREHPTPKAMYWSITSCTENQEQGARTHQCIFVRATPTDRHGSPRTSRDNQKHWNVSQQRRSHVFPCRHGV